MPTVYISDLRGGRNGIDAIIDPEFPMDQAAEVYNVDFRLCPTGAKRNGSTALSTSGGTAFSGTMGSLIRHMPAGDEAAAELWGIDNAFLVKRLAGGATWANVTMADAINAHPYEVKGVSFNGKLFLFYNSAQDRSHVWDGSTVRRMGLAAATAAPTVANQGAGTYAAVARYYRVVFWEVSGSSIVRVSEGSPVSTVFTPSGIGASARVTRPTAPGEGETHWIVEGSSDGTTFYQLNGTIASAVAIATTTYDDTSTVASYSSNTISPSTGTNSVPTSMKFGITDGNRLIMAGSFEGGKGSRIYFTRVLGSTNRGDDEALPTLTASNNYIDINEKDGGSITSLAGPMNSLIYAFKYRQIWKLVGTGDITTPYIAKKVSNVVGAISDKAVILAEDALGNPAIYFLSSRGPYRLGVNGLEYLGRDIEDYWYGLKGKSKINLASTINPHGQYYMDAGQIWWWIGIGNINGTNLRLRLDIKSAIRRDRFGVRGGWAVDEGANAGDALCSVMFSNTVGASMSYDLKPYMGFDGATILKGDSGTTDNGTTFQSYVKTRSLIQIDGVGKRYQVREAAVIADAATGVTLECKIIRDYGAEERSSTILLTADGSEDHIHKRWTDAELSDGGVFQIQYGDVSAVDAEWETNMLMVNIEPIGDLVAGS